MKSKSGLITQEQAAIEIMNVDISRIMEETISFFEERDNFELAAKLRGKTPGVDILTDDLDSESAIVLKRIIEEIGDPNLAVKANLSSKRP
jgi:hypothetical protein